MLNTLNSNENEKKKNGNWFKKWFVAWALAATLIWWWAYLVNDKISFSWETKEYVIDAKQNSIIKLLKYNILNEDQKTDWALCYKLAEFIMKDNNIKNPRLLKSWTPIKFNMKEINKIIKEHQELKLKKTAEVSENGLDIYEDSKEPKTTEEKELQEIISNDINEEADVELYRASKLRENNKLSEEYEEMRCKWWEYFWIDISHHNKRLDIDKLLSTNRKKWDSKKPDVRWMSFVYIRAADGLTNDRLFREHTNVIRKYNENKNVISNKEKIAVWYYHRINLAWSWVEQANLFLKLYNKNQWIAGWNTLIPMLDFEWKWLSLISKEDARKKALNWLSTVEKWTGVTPGLYVTPSIYKTYFEWDSRFKSFPLWIAAYPAMVNWKEIWPSPRINFKDWTVNVAHSLKANQQWIHPACYQSSQQWRLPWTGNWDWYTDIDHSKNIDLIVTVENKSDWKWEQIKIENPNKPVNNKNNKINKTVNKKNKQKADKKAKAKRRTQKASRKQQRKWKK